MHEFLTNKISESGTYLGEIEIGKNNSTEEFLSSYTINCKYNKDIFY